MTEGVGNPVAKPFAMLEGRNERSIKKLLFSSSASKAEELSGSSRRHNKSSGKRVATQSFHDVNYS